MKMYPTLYSYEEFDMLRVVGQKVEPVIVAIDFFDFYYIHKDIRLIFDYIIELNLTKVLEKELIIISKKYCSFYLRTTIKLIICKKNSPSKILLNIN